MKKIAILISLLLCVCLVLTGCGAKNDSTPSANTATETKTESKAEEAKTDEAKETKAEEPKTEEKPAAEPVKLTIAYQGGIGYAPVHVMENQKLIEAAYDGDIQITFTKLDSGAAINEGIIGGTIDIGCMGLGPAITGVSRGIPYRVISSLCAQSHGLMSNDPSITKLSDITPTDKIALVNTGSFQHILLALAAEKSLGDAHALDNNIQAMSHAEGMASLESGTVKLHLTSSPFIYQERDSGKYTELKELSEVWPSGNTFLVAMASENLAKNEKLFAALKDAFAKAMDYIHSNPEDFAKIETEYLGLDLDTVKSYINQPDCQFSAELKGVGDMVAFMLRAGFIEKEVTMDSFVYEGVKGN